MSSSSIGGLEAIQGGVGRASITRVQRNSHLQRAAWCHAHRVAVQVAHLLQRHGVVAAGLDHLNLVAQQEFVLCLELGPAVANRAVRDNPQVNGFVASQTALGRVGGPDDIGALVAGLLSSTGDWVNVQRIDASGGIFI